MTSYICNTCGIQYAATDEPPSQCVICTDERQYIGLGGQQWTTLEKLQQTYSNKIESIAPNLFSIRTEPNFAIAQRAFLVKTAEGNILWDCLSLIDDDTIAAIKEEGNLQAIALSHPHYYGAMVEWSKAFSNIPIYIHEKDRDWVTRPDNSIIFWQGNTHQINQELTLINCGGHFAGGTVLHWRNGAEGKGILLSGDIIQVVADCRYVSFMYSYPNLIPMSAEQVDRIVEAVEPFAFDCIYSAFTHREVTRDAKEALHRSAMRYKQAIEGKWIPAISPLARHGAIAPNSNH